MPAAACAVRIDPEQRHDAVADELVDAPALRLDRPPHGLEVLIEQEHHVVRQTTFGHPGERAQVGEHYRDFPLHALARIDLNPDVLRPGSGGQQRHHREIVGRPQLAGEAHVGAGAPIRARTRASSGAGGGRCSAPSPRRTRQVEHRPRPPHTEACGTPAARLASSTLIPGSIDTLTPSG